MLDETDSKFPLPPCRVCGAPGAGFHYGVNTCEACKGFFHRSLNHWSRYKCVNKGNCTVQHGKGKMCRLCRYQKCLNVGMSKSAIKTGRYNYKKKTDDILEVKQLVKELGRESKMELASQLNFFHPGTVSPPSDSGSQDCFLERAFEASFLPKSNSNSLSPAPSSSSGDSRGPKTDFQIFGKFGKNHNKVQSSNNSPSSVFGSYSVSPDSTTQWTPESFTSTSPPSTASEVSRSMSPSSSMSPFLSPHCANLSPSSSFTDRTRFVSCESDLPQSHSPSGLENILNTNSSSKPSSCAIEGSISFRHSGDSSMFKQDDSIHERTMDSDEDLFPLESPSPTNSVPIINTLRMLSIEGDSNSGDPTPENSPEISPACENSQRSYEVSESSNDVTMVEELYRDKDEVIRGLVEAHLTYVTQHFQDIPKEELERQQREHYESCVMHKEIFGHNGRLPDQEYDQLYGATGIDADNRLKRMKDFAKAMEETIQLMVCFAMTIPGFADLPKKTKLHLIKYSRQDFSLLNLIKYVNLELKVYRGVENGWQCSLEMENSKYREVLDTVFMFLGKFQTLNLTVEERVVLHALVIMAPDRECEVESSMALAIYDQLVNLVIYQLGRRHDRPLLVFAKLMGLVTELRSKVEEMCRGFREHNLLRYMPINDKPLIQLMYSGIYF